MKSVLHQRFSYTVSMTNEINIPYIAADESGPKHLLVKVSRSKLESVRIFSLSLFLFINSY